ncbi:hypothetical protein ACKLNO_08855 [Neisseriaceae bacterium B1]
MVKHTFFPCDAISLTEKIFLAMIVQTQADVNIKKYLQTLITHSVVTERHTTTNCGKYVYFETPSKLSAPPDLHDRLLEASTDNILFLLYLNEDLTKLDFLEITLLSQDVAYDEECIAHSVVDKMWFQAA